MSDNSAIIIDNGSDTCKIGFAGDTDPRSVFPSIVGVDEQDTFVGEEAQTRRDFLTLEYPIERGIITNWENMEKVWKHSFEELCVDSSNHSILLTHSPFSTKENREKMAEIMFEKFDTPAMYVAMPAVLSLYSAGRLTGIVLDSGHGVSYTVPIYEGYAVTEGVHRLDVAGNDLTSYLKDILLMRGHSADLKTIRIIKEKFCYTALDFEKEMSFISTNLDKIEKTYEHFTLGMERFQCPEALFNPSLLDKETNGIHEMIHNSIKKCDMNIQKDLYSNIILSGGTTLISGFEDRLKREIISLVPPSIKVKVIASQDRKYNAWIGGSILAGNEAFQEMWISKDEFKECGAEIVHKKCFF